MSQETGHTPNTNYFDRSGNLHLNGGSLWVMSGSKLMSDDGTPVTLGAQISQTTTDSITAHAGGGQASATQLTTDYNRVTTVASAADSVKLMPSFPGMEVTITNTHATNALAVFPSAAGTGTEQINALGANTAFSLAATKTVTIFCATAGQMHTVLSA